MGHEPATRLSDAARLEALRRSALMRGPPRPVFTTLARMLARLTGAPLALVAAVDDRSVHILGGVGAPELQAGTELPLDQALCPLTLMHGALLAVPDARRDPRTRDQAWVSTLGMGAYLGTVLTDPGGQALGTVAVMDRVPRPWNTEDQRHLQEVSELAAAEVYRGLLERSPLVSGQVEAAAGFTEAARRRARHALSRLIRRAITHSDVRVISQEAVSMLGELLGGPVVAVLQRVSEQSLLPVATQGLRAEPSPIPVGPPDGPLAVALRANECLLELDLAALAEGGPELLRVAGVRTLLVAALPGEPSPHGLLCVGTHEPRHFTEDERFLVGGFSHALGAAFSRRASEAELKNTYNLLLAVVEGTTDAIYVKDIRGRYLMMNHAGAQMMGRTVDEVLGRSDGELFHPDTARAIAETDAALLRSGQCERFEEVLRVNGTTLVMSTCKGVYRDGAGRPVGVVGISRDITEQKRTERALRESEERFRLVFQATHDVIYDWDLESGRLYWNDALAETLGYRRGEVGLGLEWWEAALHPEDRAGVMESLETALHGNAREWTMEYRFRRADGRYATLLDRGTFVRNATGRAVRMIGCMVDISARKQAELMERALAEAGRVLGVCVDANTSLPLLADSLCRRLVDGCMVVSRDERGVPEVLASASEDPERAARLGRVLDGATLRTSGTTLGTRAEPAELATALGVAEEAVRALGLRGLLTVPFQHGQVEGALTFLDLGRRELDEIHAHMAQELGPRIACALDIHRLYREAKAALRARERSLAILNSFMRVSPVGIAFLDRDLRFVHVNEPLARLHGRAVEDYVGRTATEVLGPQGVPLVERLRGLLTGQEQSISMELRFDGSPGGGPQWRQVNYFPVRLTDGELLGVGGVFVDVTERKREEEDQRFLAAASEAVTGSLDQATTLATITRLAVPALADLCILAVKDGEGRPQRVEAAHVDPLKEERLKELVRQQHSVFSRALMRVLDAEKPMLCEEVTPDELRELAEGEEDLETLQGLEPRSVLALPLRARNRTLGALLLMMSGSGRGYTARDLVTVGELARRAALALDNAQHYRVAQQATRAREELLAVVSHDLRTPLGNVLLSTSMLQKLLRGCTHDATLDRHVESIRRAATRMERLITDLLDLASIERGQLSIEPQPHRVRDILDEAVQSHEQMAALKSITLRRAPVPGPLNARCDRERTLQALSNLLGNAIKFTPVGGTVTLAAEPRGNMVDLTVTDTGPGIPADEVPHIFERFWRNRRHGEPGVGLGLSIARGIALAHGGRIWVDTAPGRGCTFHLTLPLEPEAGRPAQAPV
ncbi:MAG: PAS domain S-box protein [Myxococcota bacterium]